MYTIKSILFNVDNEMNEIERFKNGNDLFPNFHYQKKKKKSKCLLGFSKKKSITISFFN
jgi:hypothetical protein